MLEFLKSVLSGHNQFASGGLLLMIIGGLSVYLRAIPQQIWEWFVEQTTLMITVKDDDAAFVWVKEWFLEQKFLKRIRRVDLDTAMRNERGCAHSRTGNPLVLVLREALSRLLLPH